MEIYVSTRVTKFILNFIPTSSCLITQFISWVPTQCNTCTKRTCSLHCHPPRHESVHCPRLLLQLSFPPLLLLLLLLRFPPRADEKNKKIQQTHNTHFTLKHTMLLHCSAQKLLIKLINYYTSQPTNHTIDTINHIIYVLQ